MDFVPTNLYPYAYRRGDKSSAVGVLQLNLGDITVDGDFGGQTEKAVLAFQARRGLEEDGIAGMQTQQALIVQLQRPASKKHVLPPGLLKSIAFNESGFALAAAGPHLSDSGWDIGAFCRSSGSAYPTQGFLRDAYDVSKSAEWTAAKVVEVREGLPATVAPSRYLDDLAGGKMPKFRWQLAILAHNWPAAADNIAHHGTALRTPGADDQPADWIIAATGGRLKTPREWCMAYVARATAFCRW